MLDNLPPFMTVKQAAEVLQVGRSTAYELTVEYEASHGRSGLPKDASVASGACRERH